MSERNTNQSAYADSIFGQLIQPVDETPRGVFLQIVKPQPLCNLVFSSEPCQHGEWRYPVEYLWRQWNDTDYRLPENMSEEERKKTWGSPYRTGRRLYVREPWRFRKCCDCYACETPQTRYCGKLGCFEYPTVENQGDAKFLPAHSMPPQAARTFFKVTAVQMMRLWHIPVEWFQKNGFICPDGKPFPKDLRSFWDNFLSAEDLQLYNWASNPLVWVTLFEK